MAEAVRDFFWRIDFVASWRNWTIGVSWNDDSITFALGPVGLMYNRE